MACDLTPQSICPGNRMSTAVGCFLGIEKSADPNAGGLINVSVSLQHTDHDPGTHYSTIPSFSAGEVAKRSKLIFGPYQRPAVLIVEAERLRVTIQIFSYIDNCILMSSCFS